MRTLAVFLLAAIGLAGCGDKPEAPTGQGAETAAAAAPAERLVLGADGVPRFREGLWEVTKIDGGEREVSKHCAGAEVRDDVREMLTREAPGCTSQRSNSPLGIKVRATCDQGSGVKTETDLSMSGSATTWNMKLGIYVLTPDGERDGGEMTVNARWIGACPAGVKPGEEVEG